jgi:two-component system CheB/CheR fusion protein
MATRRLERNRARPVRNLVPSATSAAGPDEPTDLGSVPTIVALGSSAGGLDALTRFFSAMPPKSGMAFVIVAHLDPTRASLLAELLGRCTAMRVLQVEADTPIEADHVYCIPPGKYLSISGRTLRVTTPCETASVRMPIDFFLRSLAGTAAGPVIGIILSGTGSDGTIGLREIKAAGGLAIAQDPASAEHDGMPRSAIESGATDHILPPDQVAGILIDHVRHLRAHGTGSLAPTIWVEPDALNELLDAMHGRTKLDLRSYKRSTRERRIGRRMGLKHVDVAGYTRLLLDDPAEVAALSDDLLISVTNFFRDPEAWSFLQEHVIRSLVLRTPARVPLRVWVPGCATGEEAYSVAMLLIEELQVARKTTRFRSSRRTSTPVRSTSRAPASIPRALSPT